MSETPEKESEAPRVSRNFIEMEIDRDLAQGRTKVLHTRFPPEPNGYLHLGHAKALCVNFGLAQQYEGLCNLRFDDTNPSKEEDRYVDAIQEDVRWLGFDWQDRLFFASDFFEELYGFAQYLIEGGHAYVDDLGVEEMRAQRGGPNLAGTNSPNRDRPNQESLDLFGRMRAGEFEPGSVVLRAKIDMAHTNLLMRDPVLYRIQDSAHHRTGRDWCIYPTYDMAHGQCDALEKVSHSLCSLEFENHRPLYDWLVERLPIDSPPRQIEFSRLNLTYTLLSKRRLVELVEGGHVDGWDDPRLPTLQGLRRRGYTPESVRNFCARIGVTKVSSTAELFWLEDALREDQNRRAPRRLGVLDPLKVTIRTIDEGQSVVCQAVNNPEDEDGGTRDLELTRQILIERNDFLEDAPRKFFRLRPEGQVRLRYGPILTCEEVIKDESGQVIELICSHDERTFGGASVEGQKRVKGIIHWVSADKSVAAEVHLLEPLFLSENPGALEDWLGDLNPDSRRVISSARLEASLLASSPGETFQFERLGYFTRDASSPSDPPVFLRTVTLKDRWSKKG